MKVTLAHGQGFFENGAHLIRRRGKGKEVAAGSRHDILLDGLAVMPGPVARRGQRFIPTHISESELSPEPLVICIQAPLLGSTLSLWVSIERPVQGATLRRDAHLAIDDFGGRRMVCL